MKKLSPGYISEIDSVDKDTWFEIFKKFDDANIYQTWSYDAIRCGRNNISHLVLKKDGDIVAAAQTRIAKVPIVKAGIAYVRWGPLWKLSGIKANTDIFRQAIRALRNEYVCRRGLVLRLYPVLFKDECEKFFPILQQEGFSWLEKGKHERTLIIDLSRSLNDLRKGLHQKWRYNLKRAEKKQMEIIEENDEELFKKFIEIYREMLKRKKFIEPNNINEFRLIQKDLPKDYKMKIMLCRFEGKICAGAIFSAIGNKGIYLFGATNSIGMKTNGAYLLHWKFIEWLKQNNFTYYDLHGINPETNPGTYRFKDQLCGKNGKDVYFLGQFETWKNPLSFIFIQYAQILLAYYKKTKEIIYNLRQTKR